MHLAVAALKLEQLSRWEYHCMCMTSDGFVFLSLQFRGNGAERSDRHLCQIWQLGRARGPEW